MLALQYITPQSFPLTLRVCSEEEIHASSLELDEKLEQQMTADADSRGLDRALSALVAELGRGSASLLLLAAAFV